MIADLGFRLSLWNGSAEAPVVFFAHCGAWSAAAPNSFVLNLPELHAELEAAGYITTDLTYPSYRALWRALRSRPETR